MHALAQHRARLCDDRALDDAGMTGKHGFDLGGIDLQAAAVDHVLLAIEYPHQILRVDRTEIAGVPKAAGETLGRRLGIVPVSPDDRTAVNPDLADLAARHLAALDIHHDDMRARTGQADAVEMRGRQFRRHDGRRRGGLGRTVGVDQPQAGNLGGQFFNGRDRHRRAAISSDTPSREIDQRSGATYHAHDIGDHARHMGERHRGDRTIRRRQLHAGLIDHRRMDDVAMREHRPFGPPGGAGRVQDHGGVFFADGCGHLCGRVIGQVRKLRRALVVIDGNPVLQIGNIAAIGQPIGQRGLVDQEPGAAIGKHIGYFRLLLAGAEDDRHGAEMRSAEHRQHEFNAVAEQERDAIAALQAHSP